MKHQPENIFANLPADLDHELCQTLLSNPSLSIERIVSNGHSSPSEFWYDQTQDEWILVIQGQARLQYDDLSYQQLAAGDYVLIPAHCRHRVDWTTPEIETIWLAIFISA
jgi:cupin 2 domain-containing protein